jgi:hypothetical protein
MRKVIGYCRVSSGVQKDNLSIQKQKINYFCNENDCKLIKIYEDVCSGLPLDYSKKQLSKVIDYCENHKDVYILVVHIDRLTRNLELYDNIINKGIKIITIYENDSTIEEYREFVKLANKEPKIIKERQKLVDDYVYDEVINFVPEKIYINYRCASFDIETTSLDIENGIIKLISLIMDNGEKILFVNSNKIIEINKVIIYHFNNECDMLIKFIEVIKGFTPLVLLGYNIYLYDWKVISKKLQFFNIDNIEIKQYNGYIFPNIDGLIIIDLMCYVRKQIKLRKYSLNTISKKYLNDSKLGMSGKNLIYYLNRDRKIRKIGLYCLKDSILVFKLEGVFKAFLHFLNISNVLQENINIVAMHEKKNVDCRFVIIFFEQLEKLKMKNNILICLIFILKCLSMLIQRKVNKNLLYYITVIKETFFNNNSNYKYLVSSNEEGIDKSTLINNLTYYTYNDNKIVPFTTNIKEVDIDIEIIFVKSIKNKLNIFLNITNSFSINCSNISNCIDDIEKTISTFNITN